MSPVSFVSPDVVRALVRQALEEQLGIRPSAAASSQPARLDHLAHPAQLAHPSLSDFSDGPECTEDIDLPVRTPCLIEPHRPCYNSGYCRKLGH